MLQLKADKLDQLKHRQEIERFSTRLQKGDIGISQFIDYAFTFVGQTKAGKTSSCHFACGNSLKGYKMNGEQMVEPCTSKNKKAKIGNELNSETLMPNFFEVNQKVFMQVEGTDVKGLEVNGMKVNGIELKGTEGKGILVNGTNVKGIQIQGMVLKGKIYVIDTPGYADTKGVLTILSNGYYHYRLYSKVKNMKFILCFDMNQLKNTAAFFISTIVEFTSSFKNYLDNKAQIWKCCAFLFTKLNESQYSLKDLYDKLQTVLQQVKTQLLKKDEDALKDFIRFIINQKRIFYIKKIRVGESASSGQLLRQINTKISHWWSREIDEKKKEVNMEPVQFSLGERILQQTTKQKKSLQQFSELIRYYNIRINEFVKVTHDEKSEEGKNSLSFVLNQLVNDAMGHPQSRTFLQSMENYINKYYNKLDANYKEERQKREKQLFGKNAQLSHIDKSTSKKSTTQDKNYLVKKFYTLRKIQLLKSEINESEFEERSLVWLEQCEKNLYNIISELSKVSYRRVNTVSIIYKYGYLIHRIVEEAKMFLLLVKLSTDPKTQKKITEAANNEFIELMRPLKDFMGLPYIYKGKDYHFTELHKQFVQNFNQKDATYQKLTVNESLIDFFSDVQNIEESDSQKIVNLILKYSNKVLNDESENFTTTNSSITKLLLRLTNARMNCEQVYSLSKDDEPKIKNMSLIRKTTKNLGKMLQRLDKYSLARKVFDTIKFVDSVCKLYKLELDRKESNIKDKDDIKEKDLLRQCFELRMEYSTYLAGHFREQEAINLLQQTFQLAQDLKQLETVKEELVELKLRLRGNNGPTQYEEKLFNGDYFQLFTSELQNQIQAIAQTHSNQTII